MLDEDLKIRDGADHTFYAQFNKLEKINHYIVAYSDAMAVGCGAFRQYDEQSVEIKRMFVSPEFRAKGVATAVLKALEDWATEEGFASSILETGLKQPEAIGLYRKNGYMITSNYGPYEKVVNSLCMKKNLYRHAPT
jgi:putative acetyltransferase